MLAFIPKLLEAQGYATLDDRGVPVDSACLSDAGTVAHQDPLQAPMGDRKDLVDWGLPRTKDQSHWINTKVFLFLARDAQNSKTMKWPFGPAP